MIVRLVLVALCCALWVGCGEDDGAGTFGTLALSGPDTAEVGTTFTPALAIENEFGGVSTSVTWYLDDEPVESRGALRVWVNTDGGGADIASVDLALPIADPQVRGFSWLGVRQPDQVDIDLEARSITFESYVLEPVVSDSEPASITLNGALTW